MFAGIDQTTGQQEIKTREREGQDATKITFAHSFKHPISLVSDADSDDNADTDGEKHHN